MESLFEKISIAGLTSELLDKVRETRPTCSPNTINLALKDERDENDKPPLRRFICEIATNLLKEKNKPEKKDSMMRAFIDNAPML